MEFSFVDRITGNDATGSWGDANIAWNTDQTYATYYNAGFSYNNATPRTFYSRNFRFFNSR